MKTLRKDQQAIASLLFENHLESPMDIGMDSSIEPEVSDTDVVMELEPIAPVSPEFEEDDDLYKSVKADLKKLNEYSNRLQSICKPNGGLEPWMLAKLSKAAEYVSDVYFMLDDSVDFANSGFDQAGPEQNI